MATENAEVRVVPAPERATADRREVAALVGISVPLLDRLRKSGSFPQAIRLGSRVLWSRQTVLDFIRAGGRIEAR